MQLEIIWIEHFLMIIMPDLEKFKLRDFYILKESIIEIRATISQLFGNIYTNNKIMKDWLKFKNKD